VVILEFPYGLYEETSISSVSDWNMWYSTCQSSYNQQSFRSKLNANLKRRSSHSGKQVNSSAKINVVEATTHLFKRLINSTPRQAVSFVQERSSLVDRV